MAGQLEASDFRDQLVPKLLWVVRFLRRRVFRDHLVPIIGLRLEYRRFGKVASEEIFLAIIIIVIFYATRTLSIVCLVPRKLS